MIKSTIAVLLFMIAGFQGSAQNQQVSKEIYSVLEMMQTLNTYQKSYMTAANNAAPDYATLKRVKNSAQMFITDANSQNMRQTFVGKGGAEFQKAVHTFIRFQQAVFANYEPDNAKPVTKLTKADVMPGINKYEQYVGNQTTMINAAYHKYATDNGVKM